MRTDQRLTAAYENARVEHLDAHSRYVIMSDCHRGDGSTSDEFVRNENVYLHALGYYLDGGFTYVEAGDGDEMWEHREFKYIKNAHHDVFDAIKRFFDDGRFIVLWGNHNIYLRDRDFVVGNYYHNYDEYSQVTSEFLMGVEPCAALVLRDAETSQEFLVLHGHQGDFANDQAWFATMLTLRYFWKYLHAFGIKNPASPVKNASKRHALEKRYNAWIAKHRTALICGHTHRLRFPRTGEPPYFNAGSSIHPTSVTAIEIVERTIQAVRWRVVASDDGVLRIDRDVIRGPEPIAKFDIR